MSMSDVSKVIRISAVASRMAGLNEVATGLAGIRVAFILASYASRALAAQNAITTASFHALNLAALGGPLGLLAIGGAAVVGALAGYALAGGFGGGTKPMAVPSFVQTGLGAGGRYMESPTYTIGGIEGRTIPTAATPFPQAEFGARDRYLESATYITVNVREVNTKAHVRSLADDLASQLEEQRKKYRD